MPLGRSRIAASPAADAGTRLTRGQSRSRSARRIGTNCASCPRGATGSLCVSRSASATFSDRLTARRLADADFDDGTVRRIRELEQVLAEIQAVITHHAEQHFLALLWAGSGPATTLSAELERIISESDRLNCSSAADIEAILTRDEEARQRDVAALEDDLRRAAADPQLMEETLMRGRSTKAPLAVVSAMFKRSEKATSDVERRFLRRGVDVLSVAYGVEPMRANWLISSFEIELGPKVGQGGFAVRICCG